MYDLFCAVASSGSQWFSKNGKYYNSSMGENQNTGNCSSLHWTASKCKWADRLGKYSKPHC